MAEWLAQAARYWRARCDEKAEQTVLVLGDSHVRVFEHWWFMWALPRVRWCINYVPGATASGLYNPKSITQTYARLMQSLEDAKDGWVILNLGEVDTGYGICVRAERHGQDPRPLVDQAAQNYERFIAEIAAKRPLIVLSAPLPTLPDTFVAGDDVLSRRKAVAYSQLERTELTLAFNERIAQACTTLNVHYLNDEVASRGPNGLVKIEWLKRESPDHHYDRKTYAKWLTRQLKPLLMKRH